MKLLALRAAAMRLTTFILVASLATLGVTLVAGEAEARCVYGSTPDCVLAECMDCAPTLPDWRCDLWPDGTCRCAPECAPP